MTFADKINRNTRRFAKGITKLPFEVPQFYRDGGEVDLFKQNTYPQQQNLAQRLPQASSNAATQSKDLRFNMDKQGKSYMPKPDPYRVNLGANPGVSIPPAIKPLGPTLVDSNMVANVAANAASQYRGPYQDKVKEMFPVPRYKDGGMVDPERSKNDAKRVDPTKPEGYGLIEGPGTGKSDDIDATLNQQDYILPVETVEMIGRPVLDSLVARIMGDEQMEGEGQPEVEAKVSNQEYRVPYPVVEELGVEFFDRLKQMSGVPDLSKRVDGKQAYGSGSDGGVEDETIKRILHSNFDKPPTDPQSSLGSKVSNFIKEGQTSSYDNAVPDSYGADAKGGRLTKFAKNLVTDPVSLGYAATEVNKALLNKETDPFKSGVRTTFDLATSPANLVNLLSNNKFDYTGKRGPVGEFAGNVYDKGASLANDLYNKAITYGIPEEAKSGRFNKDFTPKTDTSKTDTSKSGIDNGQQQSQPSQEVVKNILGQPVQTPDNFFGGYKVYGDKGATAIEIPWNQRDESAQRRFLPADQYNELQNRAADYQAQRNAAVIPYSEESADNKYGSAYSRSQGGFSPNAANLGQRQDTNQNDDPKFVLGEDGSLIPTSGKLGLERFNQQQNDLVITNYKTALDVLNDDKTNDAEKQQALLAIEKYKKIFGVKQ